MEELKLMPTQNTDRKAVSIQIELSAGDFPTGEEFELRWALEDQIAERGVGQVGDSGAGGGRMDFSFEVSGDAAVQEAIEKVRQLLEEYRVLQRATITVDDVFETICDETPNFQPGDCLSFRFDDGDYGAVMVLARDDAGLLTTEELLTLVGVLDYKDPQPPSRSMFEARRWLIATADWRKGEPYLVWLNCYGGIDIATVGNVSLRANDPTTCKFHLAWEDLPEHFLRNNQQSVT